MPLTTDSCIYRDGHLPSAKKFLAWCGGMCLKLGGPVWFYKVVSGDDLIGKLRAQACWMYLISVWWSFICESTKVSNIPIVLNNLLPDKSLIKWYKTDVILYYKAMRYYIVRSRFKPTEIYKFYFPLQSGSTCNLGGLEAKPRALSWGVFDTFA